MADTDIQTMQQNQMANRLPPGTVTLPPALHGVLDMPASKQMGLIFSLAAVIAMMFYLVVWSQAPSFTPLYSSLEGKDAADVANALQSTGIPYKIETATGMILVAADKIHEARISLAAQGLPKSSSRGMELLQEEQSFGTSQFVETARYHHALESELARTISSLRNVRSSRVHLALPKQSLFVRDRVAPSASVVVDLISGEGINGEAISAIINLVSSSVPHMTPQMVTVVDQNGRLLSEGHSDDSALAVTGKQFHYRRQLELDYVRRIEALLTPIVGFGKVRAQVSAEVEFEAVESTSENFNPQNRVVRSEQTSESRRFGGDTPEGIPGALSNQPAQAAELSPDTDINAATLTGDEVVDSNRNAVRNYEVDRTISHTRRNTGDIKRLTVAVLIDNQSALAKSATGSTATANKANGMSPEQIQRLTTLVQEAIGFDAERGDRVNIVDAAFVSEKLPAPVEISVFEQPWFWPTLKYIGAGLLLFYMFFFVLKPALKNLSNYRPPAQQVVMEQGIEGSVERTGAQDDESIPLPDDHDSKVEFAQAMVGHDPKRVAKVVKEWVANG